MAQRKGQSGTPGDGPSCQYRVRPGVPSDTTRQLARFAVTAGGDQRPFNPRKPRFVAASLQKGSKSGTLCPLGKAIAFPETEKRYP
jgi:hypothetical protein